MLNGENDECTPKIIIFHLQFINALDFEASKIFEAPFQRKLEMGLSLFLGISALPGLCTKQASHNS